MARDTLGGMSKFNGGGRHTGCTDVASTLSCSSTTLLAPCNPRWTSTPSASASASASKSTSIRRADTKGIVESSSEIATAAAIGKSEDLEIGTPWASDEFLSRELLAGAGISWNRWLLGTAMVFVLLLLLPCGMVATNPTGIDSEGVAVAADAAADGSYRPTKKWSESETKSGL